MSTSAAEYENEVASLIQKFLDAGDLGISAEAARVRRKPRYFSRARMKDIEFDVSVEVFRKGATDPYWIWILECKRYAGNVPVDDAEEFHAKIQQVGPDRTKGTVVAPHGFSSGTISYCRSEGIGLWRFDHEGEFACIVEADTLKQRAIVHGMEDCGWGQPYFFGLSSCGILSVDPGEVLFHELSALRGDSDRNVRNVR